ncbi:hypothetical protein CAPTEDRAFT_173234 [Capitella teleta]|uniref:Mevalonate kinase n=1 Tax=Capitella teleta TaxID=283909 RepID=R7T9M8_CAPTE|nr:hypothetical protein CAPTEDRAFT_173234 [Capitella teleta]|eukprot:ELT90453.1 hypothetical protein CAPTEDRAFT_173234 [Capitella teleta]
MESICVSAPGKLILHGEHAVVYGKVALAASLNLRSFLKLTFTSDDSIEVFLPDIDIHASWKIKELQSLFSSPHFNGDVQSPQEANSDCLQLIRHFLSLSEDTHDTKPLALVAFVYLLGHITQKLSGMKVELRSSLPTGAGLGSSAAFSTCLAAGLLVASGSIKDSRLGWEEKELDLINKWAFQGEKVIHGRPSGIDNSVSTFGGALCFQGGKITPLEKVPKLDMMLVNTKVPRSTKILVAGLRERYEKYPDIYRPVIDSVEAISVKCEETLSHLNDVPNDPAMIQTLRDLIGLNHHHLNFLGVGHKSLDEVCSICTEHGLSAKLTGAGGGGCAFCLITKDDSPRAIASVTESLQKCGYECWRTTVGGHGVKCHDPNEVISQLN